VARGKQAYAHRGHGSHYGVGSRAATALQVARAAPAVQALPRGWRSVSELRSGTVNHWKVVIKISPPFPTVCVTAPFVFHTA
jgi:hypothetical protein